MDATDALREQGHIGRHLGGWLTEQVYDESGPFITGSGRFEALYDEEAKALGYDKDDPVILLRRLTDGKVFEAEIEVTVRPARETPAAAGKGAAR